MRRAWRHFVWWLDDVNFFVWRTWFHKPPAKKRLRW